MMPSLKQFRRTEKEIRSLLYLHHNYKGTVTEFCKVHKIHKATFYNWRNKYIVEPAGEQSFVPLQFCDPVREGTLFAEIELANDVTIKLFHKVDASYFKVLLS